MIGQLVKILTVRSVKIVGEGTAILFFGNCQIVVLQEVIEAGSKCA